MQAKAIEGFFAMYDQCIPVNMDTAYIIPAIEWNVKTSQVFAIGEVVHIDWCIVAEVSRIFVVPFQQG